jgi:anti-sigma factor RsiW
MKNCETIRESIGAWIDGELNPSESDAVRAHIEICGECSTELRQLEKLQQTLSGELTAQAAKIEFMPLWREVQRRIEQKRPWYEDLLDRGRELFPAPRLAWSVPLAIAVLLAVISVDSYWSRWRFGGTRNNFAAVESIDAHGRGVALLRENESKTTVIWLYEDQEGENEVAEEPSKSGPAF